MHGNHFNPPTDISEQLAAYSAHALSTALLCLVPIFQLGRLRQHGINCLAHEQTKVPRPGIEQGTHWLLIRHLTNLATLSPTVWQSGEGLCILTGLHTQLVQEYKVGTVPWQLKPLKDNLLEMDLFQNKSCLSRVVYI